ncbi:hypothetical protein KY495_02320 [Massilia sp. PAMC28688]|uniref:type IV pilus assembly protein FimV n=1 Tax=Massilia sp. PAMC28688 TaxID=2861283 RepID=UPI001C639F3C|nr:hypothetical protein [Massilia sp. PAMC28688]QYF94095.1 hypothetical protein KY495_02320 [Massilia sp. PAMC28688]
MFLFYRFVIVCALAGGLVQHVHAAELGEPVIRSHIGQQLSADIELNTISDPGTAVLVRMAHADVYKGANVAMNPVIGSVNMSVMKRDGRQFLHITSTRPVATENVHLFLELTDGGKRHVRAITLWLTPEPAPVAVPAAAAAAAAAPVAVPAPVVVPPAAPARVAPVLAAAAAVPVRPARVLALPAMGAASCPQPKFTAEQLNACTLVDAKNAALTAQIVDLEAKVKLLQLAMAKNGAAAGAAEVIKAVPPPPPRKKPKQADDSFPWLPVIGVLTALLAAGTGAWYILRRRRGAAGPVIAAPWRERIAARFRRAPKAVPTEAPPA